MSFGLPDDWFIEETGERLILDQQKVAAEIARLNAEIESLRLFKRSVLDPENQPSQYGTTLIQTPAETKTVP